MEYKMPDSWSSLSRQSQTNEGEIADGMGANILSPTHKAMSWISELTPIQLDSGMLCGITIRCILEMFQLFLKSVCVA